MLGAGLTIFPPLSAAHFPDVLKLATFIHFTALTILTYAQATSASEYGKSLFVLELFAVTLFAWQFRILDDISKRLEDHKAFSPFPIITYYWILASFALTGPKWVQLTRLHMRLPEKQVAPWRYRKLRGLALAGTAGGIWSELYPLAESLRWAVRWAVSVWILVLALHYLRSAPWARFGEAAK